MLFCPSWGEDGDQGLRIMDHDTRSQWQGCTTLPEKDADAEQFLQQNLGRNPDALYILAQTVLVQEYALKQAQKQRAGRSQ